ncbi:MAG: flavin reductase family protein [Actinomycetota bacterium]|nr:flavin reductase family protein [Actinomycetota bacterium]
MTQLAGPAVGADEFRAAMRRLAAGVSIISAASPQGPLGITATAVTSLSAEPPSLLCCVNKNLAVGEVIASMGRYAVNLLGREHCPLARRFAGMDGARGSEKFTAGDWEYTAGGVPRLADSLVSFECDVDRVIEAGTHYVLIGLITDIRTSTVGDPLIYCDGTFSGVLAL